NPESETSSKPKEESTKTRKEPLSVSCFGFRSFELVSDFELRISDFAPLPPRAAAARRARGAAYRGARPPALRAPLRRGAEVVAALGARVGRRGRSEPAAEGRRRQDAGGEQQDPERHAQLRGAHSPEADVRQREAG